MVSEWASGSPTSQVALPNPTSQEDLYLTKWGSRVSGSLVGPSLGQGGPSPRRSGSFPLGLKHLQFKGRGLALTCHCGPPYPLHFKNEEGDAVLQKENCQAECVPFALSFPRTLG